MNELFVVELARQRMRELGVSNFHIEPFYLYVNKGRELFITNEYLFLVGQPEGVEIISDTAYYYGDTTNYENSNVPEFTGQITVNYSAHSALLLTFVRVIIQHV